MPSQRTGVVIETEAGPGVLHQLTGVIARHRGDISSVDILDNRETGSRLYLEIDLPGPSAPLADELRALPVVREVKLVNTFQAIYGKRIIIMGGGAQVGQVAIGAISEADRHNIRGERISVDTIPLVGEQPLADAVRAVARLPRARVLVLAGSLMGGEIEAASALRRGSTFTVRLPVAAARERPPEPEPEAERRPAGPLDSWSRAEDPLCRCS